MTSLPRPAFFAAAEAMPLVIVDARVHCLLGGALGSESCLVGTGVRLRLCPAQSLAELEQEYLAQHAAEIEAFKTDYLRRTVDGRLSRLMQHSTQARDALAFLVRELIPYLHSLHTGAPPANQANVPVPVELPAEGIASVCLPGCLLSEAVGQAGLILDQYLYRLAAPDDASQGKDTPHVRLKRHTFVPVWSTAQPLEQVEQNYLAALQACLQGQARDEVEGRQQALVAMDHLARDMRLYIEQHPIPPHDDCTFYDDQAYAIARRSGIWYVCQHVAQYVVEDADGSLYHFDATTVGVPVSNQAGGLLGAAAILAPRRAAVLTPAYEHMFVPQGESSICLVKDAAYYQELRQMPLPQAICELLRANTGVLRMGHHALNENAPHRRIQTFAHRRVSRAQAEENQWPIVPYRR
jgi:hypothetical protein